MQDTRGAPGANQPSEDLGTPPSRSSPEASGIHTSGHVDTTPSMDELLREAELKIAEHHDAWLRAKAETENVRRRAQEDLAKASKFAVEKFALAMLPIKDSLEATLLAESATLDSLKAGVALTLKQLASAFQSAQISEVNPIGEKFDPHRHQAISTVESDGESNRVVTVLQKGYVLHERVLRPALVIVSKAREGNAPA
jgi:molecular chaperone GrpE